MKAALIALIWILASSSAMADETKVVSVSPNGRYVILQNFVDVGDNVRQYSYQILDVAQPRIQPHPFLVIDRHDAGHPQFYWFDNEYVVFPRGNWRGDSIALYQLGTLSDTQSADGGLTLVDTTNRVVFYFQKWALWAWYPFEGRKTKLRTFKVPWTPEIDEPSLTIDTNFRSISVLYYNGEDGPKKMRY